MFATATTPKLVAPRQADPAAVDVHLEPGAADTLVLVWAGAKSPKLHAKHGGAPGLATVEAAMAQGRSWALVRWRSGYERAPDELWAFELETPRTLRLQWQGTDGPLDADGETRHRVFLGPNGLTKAYEVSWLRRCDGAAPAWRVEVFDPDKRRFEAHAAMPWQHEDEVTLPAVVALPQPPLLLGRPWPTTVSKAFIFTSATAPLANDARALPLAGVLSDGALDTVWMPFTANHAGAAFATARSSAVVPVSGLMLAKTPTSAWPSSIVVHASKKEAFLIDLSKIAGNSAWLVLPKPIETSCLTLDLTSSPVASPIALAEVQMVTALDGEGAVNFAVHAILNASDCGNAMHLLAPQLPATEVAPQLVQGLASASSAGQACALQALARLPLSSVPNTASWLPTVVPTVLGAYVNKGTWKDETVAYWLQGGHAGVAQALLRVVLDETQPAAVRELGARLLITSKSESDRLLLLQAAGNYASETNAIIRAALARQLPVLVPTLDRALVADSTSSPSHTAALLALRRAALTHPQVGEPVWLSSVQAYAKLPTAPFAVRARALQLLGALGSLAARETLLSVCRDPDALLRHIAYESLGSNLSHFWSNDTVAALVLGLRDSDPRVRQTVAKVWSTVAAPLKVDTAARQAMLAAYRAERWPFVMSAHLSAIASLCLAEQPLAAASARDDLTADAKVTALQGLASCSFDAARSEALFALKRQLAPVPLRQAAADVLSSVGKPDDLATLFRILKQAVAASESDPSLDDVAAAAAQTMARIDANRGVEGGLFLLEQTRPRLRSSGVTVLGTVCNPAARAAIERTLSASDAWLASAARSAKFQCDKQGKPSS